MTTIVTRSGKGSALSFAEVDGNFTNLNTDKIEGISSSVDSELALWSSTTGKVLKRATISGIVKATSGVASAATAGTDYLAPPSGTAILKANSGGALANAVAGTDYAAPGTAQTWTAAQTFNSGNMKLAGSSSGSATLNAPAVAGTNTYTLPPDTATLGYRNVPQSGSDKTSSYQLATTDIGEFVGVGTGGSITIPNSTFAAGDIVSIFNNTSGNVTITCSITTAYIAGTNTDKDTMTLATRGVATILFISGTVCVVTGNVS